MLNEKALDPNIQLLGNNNMDHPHNEILFWTVEGGIIPLLGIFYCGKLFNIIWKAKKNRAWSYLYYSCQLQFIYS